MFLFEQHKSLSVFVLQNLECMVVFLAKKLNPTSMNRLSYTKCRCRLLEKIRRFFCDMNIRSTNVLAFDFPPNVIITPALSMKRPPFRSSQCNSAKSAIISYKHSSLYKVINSRLPYVNDFIILYDGKSTGYCHKRARRMMTLNLSRSMFSAS